MAKINIGKMSCETCSNAVTVKQNENGTLSYRCDECDAAPYAKTGTQQNELWRVKLSPLEKVAIRNEPESDSKQAPKPVTPTEKPATKTDMWGNAL